MWGTQGIRCCGRSQQLPCPHLHQLHNHHHHRHHHHHHQDQRINIERNMNTNTDKNSKIQIQVGEADLLTADNRAQGPGQLEQHMNTDD